MIKYYINSKLKAHPPTFTRLNLFILLLLVLSASWGYGDELPFIYKPTTSTQFEIKLIGNKVVSYQAGESTQVLYEEALKEELKDRHFILDFNFDGYKDLALCIDIDLLGRNVEYLIFYWNNVNKKLEKGQVFVNPSVGSDYIAEYFLVYTPFEVRYKWENSILKKHSKITSIGDDQLQTEIIFYKDNKQVRKVIVDTDKVKETLYKWDR